MRRIRRQIRRVSLGEADPSLTPRAGLRLVAELDRILGVVATLDDHIGPTTTRRRGLSAAELVVSMAETMLGGERRDRRASEVDHGLLTAQGVEP